jgi:hypothetical protein
MIGLYYFDADEEYFYFNRKFSMPDYYYFVKAMCRPLQKGINVLRVPVPVEDVSVLSIEAA